MLKSLFIQNFVLIDNLDIRFDKGFSVITGETEMCIRDSYMRKEKAAKLIRMGEVIFGITEGSADEKAQKSIEATEDFFHFMGLKTRLSDYGIKESDLDALVEPIDRMGWKLGEYGNINSKVAKEILLLRL